MSKTFRPTDKEMILKFLGMLIDFDKEDWDSVKYDISHEEHHYNFFGFIPDFSMQLTNWTFYFDDDNVKLEIKIAENELDKKDRYWYHFIESAYARTNRSILWSVALYPRMHSLKRSDESYSYQENISYNEHKPQWYFISKDIEDMAFKVINTHKKYYTDVSMKQTIDNMVDEFYKKKLTKKIKNDLLIGDNRSDVNANINFIERNRKEK